MKFYINEILKTIEEKLDNEKNKKILIRIENFYFGEVYYNVCSLVEKICLEKNIDFFAKVSREKYEELLNDEKLKLCAEKLNKRKWIDNENKMTYWRNKVVNKKTLILLMGTEKVEDKGGLADFYLINQEIIDKKIKNNYSELFQENYHDILEGNEYIIDNIYHTIFSYLPKNIMQLSFFIDEIKKENIIGIEDLVKRICLGFYENFEIPNIIDISKIIKGNIRLKQISLIKSAIKFKERTDYKSLNKSKYEKIEKKLIEYKKNNNVDNLDLKEYKSYEEFSQDILSYIRGIDLNEKKRKLFQIDFNIINSILNIKMSSNRKKTDDKVVKVKGEPIFAFFNFIFSSISRYKKENENLNIENIVVEIKAIKLEGVSDKENSLYSKWEQICINCKNILNFINKGNFFYNENLEEEIKVNYKGEAEIFKSENLNSYIEDGFLKIEKNKKYSKINLEICLGDHSYDYEWIFKTNDIWLLNFCLVNENLLKEQTNIPIFKLEKINKTLSLKEEEEFVDFIGKNSIEPKNMLKEVGFYKDDKLKILGKEYVDLMKSFKYNGLFGTLNNNILLEFIKRYSNYLMNNLDKKILSEDVREKEKIRMLSKLFLIVKSEESILSSREENIAIIPPIHPAVLEKLHERLNFIRDSFKEIIEKKIDENFINYLEKIDDLSQIKSGLDVAIGKNSLLSTTKNFSLFSILSSHKVEKYENRITYDNIMNKENVFSDEIDLKVKDSISSHFLSEIFEKYIEIYPFKIDGIKIMFVNPRKIEPIISFLKEVSKKYECQEIKISLYIYLSEENIGSKSYIFYWMNELLNNEHNNLVVDVFYKSYSDFKNLKKLIEKVTSEENFDIVFNYNLMTSKDITFGSVRKVETKRIENSFPMIYKPLLTKSNSIIREIELSQKQFKISTLNSLLIDKTEKDVSINSNSERSVLKKLELSTEIEEILGKVSKNSNWLVCVDKGIDKILLSKYSNIISIITGRGDSGENNVVIIGGKRVYKELKAKLKLRLSDLYRKSNIFDINKMVDLCLDYTKKLDGINILKVMDIRNTQINNYLGYLMVYKQFEKENKNGGLISLDLYSHWFVGEDYRPDYLELRYIIDNGKLKIKANIIECKVARSNIEYVRKATLQVKAGYHALKDKFNPESQSIEKKYWYLQLYKAFIYSDYGLEDESYNEKNKYLFNILNGEFEIEWEGIIYTYWLDYEENKKEEIIENEEIKIVQHIISHKEMFQEQSLGEINFIEKEESKKSQKKEVLNDNKKSNYELENIQDNKLEQELIKENNPEDSVLFVENKELKNLQEEEITLIKNNIISCLDDNKISKEIEEEYERKAKNYALKVGEFFDKRGNNIILADPIVGPTFIRVRLSLKQGVSFKEIKKQATDLKLYLKLGDTPYIFDDEGGYVSIDIPRSKMATIRLKDIIKIKYNTKDKLKFILGLKEDKSPLFLDLADSSSPHVLIAGTSGGGKSVLLNSMIINIMLNYTPEEVKFLFIDPKEVELGIYEDSPYLYKNILYEAEETVNIFKELITEMNKRYTKFKEKKVKEITSYNKKVEKDNRLPRVVVVFDEFGDFLGQKKFKSKLEESLSRIAQKARAAGIHLIVSTQSPKSEIITTTIRNNLGARIALKVPDGNASRLILDSSEAENLLGKGDMFFKDTASSTLKRLKSPYISENEIEETLEILRKEYSND
ncbi:FtsK/SpoIIIE domain-containing protein [Fusobacterium sp. MFO224]|uniref:FtsK/SpoIIIE domain-containing protein n=1 Tax=Fusobacterium sp. MFO224 TaxID=3378070 RepID=UPI0038546B92